LAATVVVQAALAIVVAVGQPIGAALGAARAHRVVSVGVPDSLKRHPSDRLPTITVGALLDQAQKRHDLVGRRVSASSKRDAASAAALAHQRRAGR